MVLIYRTLRLYGVLRSLTIVEDPNDDLLDTWKEHADSAYDGLVNLLKSSNGVPDMDYLPLDLTFALLVEELGQRQKAKVDEAEEVSHLRK